MYPARHGMRVIVFEKDDHRISRFKVKLVLNILKTMKAPGLDGSEVGRLGVW